MRLLKTLCTENDLINENFFILLFLSFFLFSFRYIEIVLVNKMGEEDGHDWPL